MTRRGQVLVTGGSGYIAGFCIAKLIQEGYAVRATLRSLSREGEVRAGLAKLVNVGDQLSFVAANLESDAGWAEAALGCDYVLHVASPLPSNNPKDDDELIRPARDGALRVLNAAKAAGVKRVVMTASTASIAYGHGSRNTPFTEADWTDETNLADTSAYERSKTIAEKAAWGWHGQHGGTMELVTVNPGAVLGPVYGRDYSASLDIVKKLLDGSVPGIPAFGWPLVDVRDIADLHFRAMITPAAAGQRFLGAGDFLWMKDIAAILREKMPQLAKRIPKMVLPGFVLRLSALFDPVIRDRLFELGKFRPISNAKSKQVLGWQPRPVAETIEATAQSLLAENIIRV
jgi:dihydroflavonol-4-reductase